MRILEISWEYPPVIEGGLGRHVAKLSAALGAHGHRIDVLTRGAVPEQTLAGVAVHRVEIPPFTRELDAFIGWVNELNERLLARGRALLADPEPSAAAGAGAGSMGDGAGDGGAGGDAGRYDVIHSHDWLVAGAARSLAREHGLPWLVTVHATEFGRHNGWVHTHPQRAIHLTERAMVRDADHVICCSDYMAGHVQRVFGLAAGSLSTIPNGIDAADLVPARGTDLGALRRRMVDGRDGAELMLLIGRLVYEKGFHVGLDALAALAAERPGLRVVVAGAGPAEADLRRQAADLGLIDRVRFLGRVHDELLHALLAVADLTVVPSLYEPFGIVPLEAMAAGCPVIVSATGGLREVVAGCPEIPRVTPGDAEALAGTIAAVLDDPTRRERMRAAGRAHAAGFSWPALAGQTEGVLAELRAHWAASTAAAAVSLPVGAA
ncbi:MAG TPA: glycosyltransferase family 4 protein [Solirubrobacteraceae bacterium]|nr:glycosyltransferase family 4 protein [Solirubrobacteraceae bacterium]